MNFVELPFAIFILVILSAGQKCIILYVMCSCMAVPISKFVKLHRKPAH